ncbi:hypothetical protein GCM10011316_21670 [Roseibium aquae]|uniref:Uncharacterized protein n=1 Tax=Roseibium aquae TaxID=1323746 RepID=A0A916TJU2_9HYPH|nr:hypothetical protein [Roseibium aquae]GGB49201.1 hypothetical protein GCM10011316_21670 [Roseibium aquae]
MIRAALVALVAMTLPAFAGGQNNPDLYGMPVHPKSSDYTSSSRVGSTTVTSGTADGKRFNFTTQDYGDRSVTTGTIDGKYYNRTCRRYGSNVQVCD